MLFDGHTSLGELADELATELGVASADVLDDVIAITEQLAQEGLLA
jgi:hypothetical protein